MEVYRMKELYYLFLSLLLLLNPSFSKNKFYFFAGSTISYFLNAENSKPQIGISFGICKSFHIYKNYYITGELSYSTRGAILENRTIAPYTVEPTEAYYWDIHGMIGFLEIPVEFQYEYSISNNIKVIPFAGPTILIPMHDFTKLDKRNFFEIYYPDQTDNLKYDLSFEEGPTLRGNVFKMGLMIGLGINYKKVVLAVKYLLDRRPVYYFDKLSEIRHRINSFYILFYF